MKRIILPLVALISMLVFGCVRDEVMPNLISKNSTKSLRTLSFRGITKISGTKGFTINATTDNNGKNTGSIDFSNSKWKTESIKVILFVKDTHNNSIVWAKQLGNGEYEYKAAANNQNPTITFATNIEYNEALKDIEKLFVYVFDKSLNSVCQKSENGYNVTIDFPSLQKNDDDTYTLKPANQQDQKIIFSTNVDMNKVISDASNHNKTTLNNINPIGTLILFSLKNTSTKAYTLNNNYLLRLETNGFSFEGVTINCATGEVSHQAIHKYKDSDDRSSYSKDTNGDIDYTKVLEDAPELDYTDIKLTNDNGSDVPIAANSNSEIYALYVMPTANKAIKDYGTDYNMLKVIHPYMIKSSSDDPEPENVEESLFKSHKLNDFSKFSGKSVSLTISVPGNVAGDIKYNALAYSGWWNINGDKTGFNKTQTNNVRDDNNTVDVLYSGMFNFDQAQKLFKNHHSFLDGYHLPSVGDWNSILVHNGTCIVFDRNSDVYVGFNPDGIKVYHSEFDKDLPRARKNDIEANLFKVGTVEFDNVESIYQHKEKDGKTAVYAIRFTTVHRTSDNKTLEKGNSPYLSVWRYAYTDNPESGKMFEIYCCVLPKNYKFTYNGDLMIDDGYNGPQSITNEDFFKSRLGDGAVRRLYPVTGYISRQDPYKINRWSSENFTVFMRTGSIVGQSKSHDVYVGPDHAHSSVDDNDYFYAVRPFFNVPRY